MGWGYFAGEPFDRSVFPHGSKAHDGFCMVKCCDNAAEWMVSQGRDPKHGRMSRLLEHNRSWYAFCGDHYRPYPAPVA